MSKSNPLLSQQNISSYETNETAPSPITFNRASNLPTVIHHVSRQHIYLYARGLRAASGISSNYDATFPIELEGIVRQKRFEADIQSINHTLADYWPCPTCFIGGYLCVPCTLGLSLLCPNICVSGAEKYVKHFISDQVNYRLEYQDRHVIWSLHRSCSGGYIMIEYDTQKEPE